MRKILLIMCFVLPVPAVAQVESASLAYVMSSYGNRMKPGDEVLETGIDRLVYYNKPCKLPIVGAEHLRYFVERPSASASRLEGCAGLTATGKVKTLVIRGEFEDWQVWPKSLFFRGKVKSDGTAEYIEPLR
jgi:hypothetical protein